MGRVPVRALVTGGGGFVGGAVVAALLERGDAVQSVARGDYPGLRERGVETRRLDLSDAAAGGQPAAAASLREWLDGVDVVFHVAAKAGIWGPAAEFERSNVTATQALLDACRDAGVRRLVLTSTPSVVHAGSDIAGGDESLPYADLAPTPAARRGPAYPRTKAVSERAVLAANGTPVRGGGVLSTVALRPHLVWGPGDTQLAPRILARRRANRLRFPGDGQALIDSTYVTDAAGAHLAAADALGPDAACAGRAYFISQGDPRPVMELVNGILAAGGLAPETRTVPLAVALAAGAAVEAAWRLLRRPDEPPMTTFLARQLSTAHWFDISAAKRDLRWTPQVAIEEGLERLAGSMR